jgi:hypothetical protein
MAQVVQQRTSPYLTVILGFTTVISLAVAVLMYTQKNKAEEAAQQDEQLVAQLAGSTDRQDPTITNMLQVAEDTNRSVVKQLQQRNKDLAFIVDAATDNYAAAMETADQLERTMPEVWGKGLVPAVRSLYSENQTLEDRIAELQEEKETQLAAVRTEMSGIQDQIKKLRDQKQQLQQKVDALPTEIADVRTEYGKQIEEMRSKHQSAVNELNNRINELKNQLQDAQLAAQTAQARANRFEEELKLTKQENNVLKQRLRSGAVAAGAQPEPVETGRTGAVVDMAARPDGQILRVIDDENLCYVNLGRADDLQINTSFAVFDSQKPNITEDNVKGTLVVTKVSQSVSECRIASHDPDNPILAGDLIVNVAFEPTVTYSFYVIGRFDLTGGGRPSPQGREQVKALIREAGGKVAEELTVQTDFLVAGPRPPLPPEPREGADLSTRAAYQEALNQRRAYDEDLALAMKLGIQVLNTNRFMTFMGLTPEQIANR